MRTHLKPLALSFFCAVLGFHSPAAAQGVPQGEPYTVRDGDTIFDIGQRAYDRPRTQYLCQVNRRVVGPDCNKLQPGMVIQIPRITPPPPPNGGEGQEAGNSPLITGNTVVAFLTGDDFAPFVDQEYPYSMFTKLLEEANFSWNGRPAKVYYTKIWTPHIKELLLERKAFEVGFPWYKPDCSFFDELREDGKLRCQYFHFSSFKYSVGFGFYSLPENDLSPGNIEQQLEGKRVCRPGGYFTFDLVKAGLIGGSETQQDLVTLIQPDEGLEECFRLLRNGGVDFVTANTVTSDATIAELDASGEFVNNPGVIASTQSLHFIVPKWVREGSALLAELDSALRKLEESGKADEIIERALVAYGAS